MHILGVRSELSAAEHIAQFVIERLAFTAVRNKCRPMDARSRWHATEINGSTLFTHET